MPSHLFYFAAGFLAGLVIEAILKFILQACRYLAKYKTDKPRIAFLDIGESKEEIVQRLVGYYLRNLNRRKF